MEGRRRILKDPNEARFMHPIVLAISTGRCGTSFLADTFKETYHDHTSWISHEYLRSDVTHPAAFFRCYSPACHKKMANSTIDQLLLEWGRAAQRGPVVDFGWNMRSLVPYFSAMLGDQLRTLFIHRHPVFTAASMEINGFYSIYKSPSNMLEPSHPRALHPQFGTRWASMTPFEKCLYNWLETNSYAIEVSKRFPAMRFLEVRSRNVFRSDEELARIARFAGFPNPTEGFCRSTKKNPADIVSLESRPIKNEWRRYRRHPEVIELAVQMGYNMDEEFIGQSIGKYQLPPGFLPYVRHKAGYWQRRAMLGQFLRRVGMRRR